MTIFPDVYGMLLVRPNSSRHLREARGSDKKEWRKGRERDDRGKSGRMNTRAMTRQCDSESARAVSCSSGFTHKHSGSHSIRVYTDILMHTLFVNVFKQML